jgi:hypothetical protein
VRLLEGFLLRLVGVSICAGVALLLPFDRDLVVRVYLLVAGGLALEALVRAAARLAPRRARRRSPRRGRREPADRPAELARLEDQVVLAAATAADLHFRLRPVLREIAAERAAARGLELDEGQAGAAWELVRPDRPAPADPFAKGMRPARLAEIVDALERI